MLHAEEMSNPQGCETQSRSRRPRGERALAHLARVLQADTVQPNSSKDQSFVIPLRCAWMSPVSSPASERLLTSLIRASSVTTLRLRHVVCLNSYMHLDFLLCKSCCGFRRLVVLHREIGLHFLRGDCKWCLRHQSRCLAWKVRCALIRLPPCLLLDWSIRPHLVSLASAAAPLFPLAVPQASPWLLLLFAPSKGIATNSATSEPKTTVMRSCSSEHLQRAKSSGVTHR